MTAQPTSYRRAFAFFDVDNTVLSFKTMFTFQDYYFRWADPENGARDGAAFAARFKELEHAGKDRSYLNRLFYQSYKDRVVDRVKLCIEEWFYLMLPLIFALVKSGYCVLLWLPQMVTQVTSSSLTPAFLARALRARLWSSRVMAVQRSAGMSRPLL